MIEGDGKTCPVAGCTRHKRGVPMCREHWMALASSQRRLLLELEECDPLAFGVGLVLAAEWISEQSPAWGRGWSAQNMSLAGGPAAKRVSKQQRRVRTLAAQRRTLTAMRDLSRKRFWETYDEQTSAWRELLGRVLPLLGAKRTALEVALAMIRGGHGTDGFCPLLVSAALDMDEERAKSARVPAGV